MAVIGELGAVLLAASAVAGGGAAASGLLTARFPNAEGPARASALLHAGLFVSALAVLVGAFALGRVEIAYVWQHTDVRYPWYYKLSGTWGGEKGTVVLWGALLAVVGAAVAHRARDEVARLAGSLLVLASSAFAAHAFLNGAFAPTSESALTTLPGGRGLQEVLVTPFMVVHPPIQFVAYALTTAPAALAVAGLLLASPHRTWSSLALRWARPAWLFATVGLGLGGLWAYYVLSFGGYWAWDPVETANLLPWLSLTAFLHAGKDLDRFADFRLAAPILAASAAILGFFASFSTRSGLWISVHAFTDPTGRFSPDAAARLVAILEAHAPSRFFLTLVVVSLLLTSAAATRAVFAGRAGFVPRTHAGAVGLLLGWAIIDVTSLVGVLFEVGALFPIGPSGGAAIVASLFLSAPLLSGYFRASETRKFALTSERGLMHAGVTVLGVGLAVAVVLHLQSVNGADRALFDARAPFVALPLVAVLTFMMSRAPLGVAKAGLLAAVPLAIAPLAAFLYTPSPAIAAAAPVLAAGLLATFVALVHGNAKPGLASGARLSGTLLVASGLLGAVLWANPPNALLLPVGSLPVALSHAVLLLGASVGALACGILVLRGFDRTVARAGAVLAVLAWGFGAGAVLAIAAAAVARPGDSLVLVRGRLALGLAFSAALGAAVLAAAIADGALSGSGGILLVPALLASIVAFGWLLRRGAALRAGTVPRLAQAATRGGIYLVHVALVLGLAGYAASTYGAERVDATESSPLLPGNALALGSTHLVLRDPIATPGPGVATWATKVVVPVDIVVDGRVVDRGSFTFEHKGDPIHHYDPVLDIRRIAETDVYLTPDAMRTSDGTWIRAHGDACRAPGPGSPGASGVCIEGPVDAVAFTAVRLPLVGLVWTGLALMTAGMLAILAGKLLTSRLAARAKKSAAGGVYTTGTEG